MDEQAETQPTDIIELAAELVAAYVSNNNVPVSELPNVIASVHAAFTGLANGAPAEPAGPEKPTPAQIRKSVTPDALISFIDGKRYKTLKRHLTVAGLTMETYRALRPAGGLPVDRRKLLRSAFRAGAVSRPRPAAAQGGPHDRRCRRDGLRGVQALQGEAQGC
ncbi:MucR family transcriptional regulator [Methylobacterium sp. WL119]|uniref:MucR family transcriptional regulator n=1 Tax=unclassified Methylobacterium TaxID=2615210 RepID=UPI0032B2506F